jgi:hypothetical protein
LHFKDLEIVQVVKVVHDRVKRRESAILTRASRLENMDNELGFDSLENVLPFAVVVGDVVGYRPASFVHLDAVNNCPTLQSGRAFDPVGFDQLDPRVSRFTSGEDDKNFTIDEKRPGNDALKASKRQAGG